MSYKKQMLLILLGVLVLIPTSTQDEASLAHQRPRHLTEHDHDHEPHERSSFARDSDDLNVQEKLFTYIVNGTDGTQSTVNLASGIWVIGWISTFLIIGSAVLCYWVGCELKEEEKTTPAPMVYGGYGRQFSPSR